MDMRYMGGGVGNWIMDENMSKSKGKLFTTNGMENEQPKMFWG
jgi:hypothetical protein